MLRTLRHQFVLNLSHLTTSFGARFSGERLLQLRNELWVITDEIDLTLWMSHQILGGDSSAVDAPINATPLHPQPCCQPLRREIAIQLQGVPTPM